MWPWLVGGSVVFLLVIVVAWRPLNRFGAAIYFERARESFRLQRELLYQQFLEAARETGKPRGLVWERCEWETDTVFLKEKRTLRIVALGSTTLHFSAVEGGPMEGVSAVGLPRNACAVFQFIDGKWSTDGMVVMNQNPDEAAEYFKGGYEFLGGLEELEQK